MLWTGGWDSTFRLLQLILVEKKTVKPYYLIDLDRKSFPNEIRAMKEIKKRLFEKFPKSKKRLLPTYMIETSHVKENPNITKHYQIINKKYNYGIQYEWLARFAAELNLDNLEMAYEKNKQDSMGYDQLKPLALPPEEIPSLPDPSVYEVFKFYKFPIFKMYKREMLVIAKEENFLDLMELIWSCHRPRRSGKPCGTCTPCINTIEDGLGQKFPLSSKIRYYVFRPKYKMKKKYPGIYNMLKNAKRILSLNLNLQKNRE